MRRGKPSCRSIFTCRKTSNSLNLSEMIVFGLRAIDWLGNGTDVSRSAYNALTFHSQEIFG